LSDGYRAYIGWIGDMLFHLCMGAASGAKLIDTRGVVLVDEIDLHLHPAWQRVVLPTLSRALPNVQFIVTTHSPLVVGSLEATNLFTLVEQDGAVTVKRLPEDVYGRSAEQILLSPYFGLDTTRAEGVSAELETLAQAAVDGDKGASMSYIRLLSANLSPTPLKRSTTTKSVAPSTPTAAKKTRRRQAL
jgi:AAA domain, putative AbiEii toxin, Type IV TA system